MENKEFNVDQIEKYLADQMKQEEKEAFEQEIAVNPALKDEVALHRDVLAGIDMHFENELKQKLVRAEKELRAGKPRSSPIIPMRWLIGIAATLLLLAISFYVFTNKAASPEEVFLTYYEPYPNIISPMERSGESQPTVLTALDYYEQENYSAAIEAFEANLVETLSQPAQRFYYALSLISSGNSTSAIPHLKELTHLGDHSFLHQSQWYLGLAYLKNKETEQARQVFDELKNTDTPYSKTAEAILEELE